jgi:uncharacterized protein YndB with AHSA1/START domain
MTSNTDERPMSTTWQRTFEVSAPVERTWTAFTQILERERAQPLDAPPDPNAHLRSHVLEIEPLHRMRWSAAGGSLPEYHEFTVVFESTATGSRFTVTRCGFGEGEDADVFGESNALGWEGGLMDIVFALETGCHPRRHYYGVNESTTGVAYIERDWGLEVLRVVPGSFGAEVGLARGDRLVRIAGAAIYTRANVWTLIQEHAPGTELEVEFLRGGERRRGRGKLSPYRDRRLAAVGE